VAIAAITTAELGVGVLLSKGRNRTARRAFLDDVLITIPVLNYDLDIARVHAELLVEVRRKGLPRSARSLDRGDSTGFQEDCRHRRHQCL
jgi:predicted nucleic acid-binding protein